LESERREQRGSCYECGGSLELLHVDVKKGTKVVRCKTCGLLHACEKDFLGRWRLRKAYRNPSPI